MYTSLRSVEVIAEVIGVLPPEGGPILQKLVKAVKEDVEEAQQEAQQRVEKAEQRVEKAEQRVEEAEQRVEKAEQRVEKAQQRVEKAEQQRQQAEQSKDEAVAVIIREKGAKMVLADKLHLRDKLLSRAMHSAGVRDGRSCLEYLEDLNGIIKWQRVQGWTKVLEQRPDLIKCLAKAVPSWGVDANNSNAAGKLAGKIAGMFNVLSGGIHPFIPGVGLVVYAGVPDAPTCEGLVCLAEALGVPCEWHHSLSP
ncbi:hypothetical protein CHLRE_17g740900v5 [Chlamydomonas reinhardtii]|uniref:Uncharacterized protein n=1 Tax=Chlamydomonas reinhardtii TaxID=3055 RepID=A0A2K3CRR5_CHLRE|nr:uncharacterized protein CHLRE_17g740900v5 [Chlamydomonas reinhardtii]PNW70968.1 hypothetical protein CHLRE_17g740900v5 [Chlamydomonas reinhardtii]